MKKYILRILYIIYTLGFIAMTFTIGFSLNKNTNNQPLNGLNISDSSTVVKEVSLGSYHSSAIVNDGTTDHLYTWGLNYDGQLGLGDNQDKNTPQEVTTGDFALSEGETIKQVSLGDNHSSAIVNDGTDHLYTWGNNYNGELGLGNNIDKNTPQEVTTGAFALSEGLD